jgi:hypothetical protein
VGARAPTSRTRRARARRRCSPLEAERSAWERLRDKAGAQHPQTARVGLLYARDLRAAGARRADVIDASMRPVRTRVSGGFGVPAWLRNRVD